MTQLAQAQSKIANLERRVGLSQQEAESELVEMLSVENRRLKERIAVLEAERMAVKSALVPALKILSSAPSSSSTVVKKAALAPSANGAAPLQNGHRATPPIRVKQETSPVADGWTS